VISKSQFPSKISISPSKGKDSSGRGNRIRTKGKNAYVETKSLR